MTTVALSTQATRPASWAAAFILVITAVRLTFLSAEQLPLHGDEAQYWVWSLAPDWGYYSKPPLIAWVIRLSTALAGEREFGVRLAAPLFHAATAWLVFVLGRRLYGMRVGAWSSVIYASLPAVSLSAVLITTDVPLLFFWAAGLVCLVHALERGEWRWWLGLGVALGLGLLSKYAMAMFVPSLLLYLAAAPARRGALRDPRLWAALALGVLIYLPNLAWNWAHGFVTFSHTGDNANLGGTPFHPVRFAEFVAAQFAVFGPLLFGVLVLVLVARFGAIRRDDRSWLLTAFILPQLCMILIVALLSRAHANWAAVIYVPATVLVVAWCSAAEPRMLVVKASLALHVLVAGVGYNLPQISRTTGIEMVRMIPVLRRVLFAPALGAALRQHIAQHPDAVLMTEDRMLFAQMAFYVRPHALQVQWNGDGRVSNHFELTTRVRDVEGDILFLTARAEPSDVLVRFVHAERLASITIPLQRDVTRRFGVYLLRDFKG